MKAIILAGGKGTRLAPYTTVLPKPLVPVGNIPIIEIIILQLISFKFSEVTIMVGYLSGLIKAYFNERPSINDKIRINYIDEETPTGTAGSLGFLGGMDDTFIVMNGDILTDLNFLDLVKYHKEQKNKLTIAMHQKKVRIDLGVLELTSENKLVGYNEKPELSYDVSMGIYVYEPEVLNDIKKGQYLDFPTLAMQLVNRGERVGGFPNSAKWLDIGRVEDYQLATEEFEKHRKLFLHE